MKASYRSSCFGALAGLLLTIVVAPASANHGIDVLLRWTDDSRSRAELVPLSNGGFADRAIEWSYDNWRNAILGGVSEEIGRVLVGPHEVGDDLVLWNGPGRLSSTCWTVAHMGTEGRGSEFTQTNRWYDQNGVLLREYVFRVGLTSAPLPPGAAYRFQVGDGFWSFLALDLPERFFSTESFSDPVGMDVADFGKIVAGPRTLGYSSRFIYNFSTGERIDLASDQANLALAVRTIPIPAPSGAAVVVIAVGLLGRRTRSRRSFRHAPPCGFLP